GLVDLSRRRLDDSGYQFGTIGQQAPELSRPVDCDVGEDELEAIDLSIRVVTVEAASMVSPVVPQDDMAGPVWGPPSDSGCAGDAQQCCFLRRQSVGGVDPGDVGASVEEDVEGR